MRNAKPFDLQTLGRKSELAVELEDRREQIRQLTANQPEPESPSPEQDSDDDAPDPQELADSHQARNGNRAQRRAAARRLARRYR